MFVLAVFNNRTQALQFSNHLRGKGVNVKVINTPREITTSCGLSIMFDFNNLNKARIVINSNKLTSFRGFYLKRENNRMYSYEKIN